MGMLGLFQTSADSPFCKTTCFTQFLLRTRPVVRLWQVNGPSEIQSFFSYSNQWQPSSVQNPQRWRCKPRERNGNVFPSHTPFNLRNIDSWYGRWKGTTRDAKRIGWDFFEATFLFLCAECLLCSGYCRECPRPEPPVQRKEVELRKHGKIAQRHSPGARTGTQAALTQDWLIQKPKMWKTTLCCWVYMAVSNPLSTHWSQAFKVSIICILLTYVHLFFAIYPTSL